ncbi:helix-turn-helix transcriptional regulator [Streptomyces sulfonofaciens]|nr:helix-turn-helix transcriptional regulator [Streptomyces sulfonofaciens]
MSTRRNAELGTFLKTCRARLKPGDNGPRPGGQRRVPGLRREEVADIAGVSLDYYARLEQGRQVTASPSVLDAVARALRLSDGERTHLYTLAGVARAAQGHPGTGPGEDTVDDRVRHVLDALGSTPAIVCGPYLDVLAANEAAGFLFTDFDALPSVERNALRWMLLAPAARDLYGDQWEESAREMVGMLRIDSGRYRKTRRADEIMTELEEKSSLFRRIWRAYQVSTWSISEKDLLHPVAGPLRFRNASISVDGVPGLTIFLVIPEDRAAFEAAFEKSRVPARNR